MKHRVFLIYSLLFFISTFCVQATQAASIREPNNKFGIHLATPDDKDLDRAAELVNSNGGEWGYVTLVIQENDRDIHKWQEVFDKLREKKLIPIIRLATGAEGEYWKRPRKQDAGSWVTFLNRLKWVVKNRYIILFNEPNHGSEWGGEVDPVSFGEVNEEFARKLKSANENFFVMMGGLDPSPPSQRPLYEDAAIFMRQAVGTIGVSDFNYLFDGLSSHSYPNPGFVGPVWAMGKGTIRTYQWELTLLKSMGVKDLPVFITETGWDAEALGREEVASRYKYAFLNIWLPDSHVKAITPFILNYQTEPFLKFSWVRPGNENVHPEFDTVKALSKIKGKPDIDHSGLVSFDLPKEIVEDSTYHFQVRFENRGEAIWDSEDGYAVRVEGISQSQYVISTLGKVKPGQSRLFDVYLNTSGIEGDHKTHVSLYRSNERVLRSAVWNFNIVPLPSVRFSTSIFPKVVSEAADFKIQVFDEYEQMVFEKDGLSIESGKGKLEEVENIALGRKYRIVLIKPFYLPRQTYITFKKGENNILFDRMLPFDFNNDGVFKADDIPSFFTNMRFFSLTPF